MADGATVRVTLVFGICTVSVTETGGLRSDPSLTL